jgi:hypothetical protein
MKAQHGQQPQHTAEQPERFVQQGVIAVVGGDRLPERATHAEEHVVQAGVPQHQRRPSRAEDE